MVAISILAGLLVFGFGVYEAVVRHRLKRGGTRVKGLVVRHNMTTGRGGGDRFAVVEFTDAWGVRHSFQSQSSGVGRFPVGGEVPVRYAPEDPGTARIDLLGRRVFDVAFPLLGGALFMALGIWQLL